MLRTTFSSLWSRKRRLLGTVAAVVIGVAFLTATLAFGDSARAGFHTAFAAANDGIDAVVRTADQIDADENQAPAPFDAAVVDELGSVPGVARVAPIIEGYAQLLGADGETIGGDGPPTVAAAWIDDPELSSYALAEGRAPSADGEVVIDRGAAVDGGLAIGDHATVLVPDAMEVTIVGLATISGEDSLAGTTYVGFTEQQARTLLLGGRAAVTGVLVAATDGVSEDDLVASLTPALPAGLEAVTGTALTAEQDDAINGDFLGFLTTALLVFAFVALLVAAFSIFNTFSIVAAQKSREAALLRAIGASRRQVLGGALLEAAIIGVVGTALGIAAGFGFAAGLQALMSGAGFELPVDHIVMTRTSVLVGVVVGLTVTLLGGIAPAIRTSRIAPMAALRDVAVDSSGRASTWRILTGALLGLAGVALVLSGTGEGALPRAGLGAVVVVFAVVLLGPLVAGPAGSLLGLPLRLRGVSGDLAGRNAVRNPRRTSGTAAALLVGVGVVSLFTVFAASTVKSMQEALDRGFGGDLVVESDSFSGAGIAPATVDEIGAQPGIANALGLGFAGVRLDGEDQSVSFADLPRLDGVGSFSVVGGDMAAVGPDDFAASSKVAAEHGWALGDTVDVGWSDGATSSVTLAVTYDDRALMGDLILPAAEFVEHVPQASYEVVLIDVADGVSLADGRAAVESVVSGPGAPDVQDRDQFLETQAAGIKGVLTVIYGLLAVAILIALMGIANTLSLSIHERTRELGLLRAVGQTRSQLRAMVRWESVLVAMFGTVGGVGLGVFLGWGMVRALNAAEGLGSFSLPVGNLVAVLVVGGIAGVLAGLRPAWRASKLDVLDAISTA